MTLRHSGPCLLGRFRLGVVLRLGRQRRPDTCTRHAKEYAAYPQYGEESGVEGNVKPTSPAAVVGAVIIACVLAAAVVSEARETTAWKLPSMRTYHGGGVGEARVVQARHTHGRQGRSSTKARTRTYTLKGRCRLRLGRLWFRLGRGCFWFRLGGRCHWQRLWLLPSSRFGAAHGGGGR